MAECIDISIDDLRELELNKELEKEAQLLGIDSVELVMKYAADSEEEFKIMQKEHYKKIAETLEIGWEEFCEHHAHNKLRNDSLITSKTYDSPNLTGF